ncbi:MAG: hypothetical protein ABJE95_24670 [Byssovorax sp.]
MMTRTRELQAKADGLVPDLRVVGYHGRLGADQTPAKRAPVYADVENRLVDIVAVRPASTKKSVKGERTVLAKVMPRPIPEDVWTSTGTRIAHPWPARLDDVVVILGPRETHHASALAATFVKDEPAQVSAFLAWLATGEPRLERLRCEHIGDLVAWCCVPDEARALWQRLATLARDEVLRSARQVDQAELKKASFWLSRAAAGDEDMYLAAAGLRQASYPHWKALLDAGVRSGTELERAAKVDAAGQTLPKLELPKPVPVRPGLQRRAVDASFALLDQVAA